MSPKPTAGIQAASALRPVTILLLCRPLNPMHELLEHPEGLLPPARVAALVVGQYIPEEPGALSVPSLVLVLVRVLQHDEDGAVRGVEHAVVGVADGEGVLVGGQ